MRAPCAFVVLLAATAGFTRASLIYDTVAEFDSKALLAITNEMDCLLEKPWASVGAISSAFDSGYFTAETKDNETQFYIWTLFKEIDPRLNMLYIGYTDGEFMGYVQDIWSPSFVVTKDENSTCLPNITSNCRKTYGENATDSVDGTIVGPYSSIISYDPRVRPWYIKSSVNGTIWSDIYVFAERSILGISAAMQLVTVDGEFLGVTGVDYKLDGIQESLLVDANTTRAFIIGSNYYLVAASVQGIAINYDADGSAKQVLSTRCNDTTIQAVSEYYSTHGIDTDETHRIAIEYLNETYYHWAQASLYDDERGLNWYIITAQRAGCDVNEYIGNSECNQCPNLASCTATNGICLSEEDCECPENYFLVDTTNSSGASKYYCEECPWYCNVCTKDGKFAECSYDEDFNYIPTSMIGLGLFLFCLSWTLSITSIVWTFKNWNRPVVKKSQPMLLIFICIGSMLSSTTILPLATDDHYVSDSEADMACFSLPWFYGIGFAFTFSALMSKLIRVKRIFEESEDMKLRKVTKAQVMVWISGSIIIEGALLTAWDIISPLSFVRKCLDDSGVADDICLDSIGSCKNGNDLYKTVFIPLLACLHVGVLLYASFICFQIRNVPTDFQEGRWITMCVFSNLQLLVLGAPLVALVVDSSTSTAFLVKSGIIFLNDTSVILLMFAPKMWELHVRPRLERKRLLQKKQREQLSDGPPLLASGDDYDMRDPSLTFKDRIVEIPKLKQRARRLTNAIQTRARSIHRGLLTSTSQGNEQAIQELRLYTAVLEEYIESLGYELPDKAITNELVMQQQRGNSPGRGTSPPREKSPPRGKSPPRVAFEDFAEPAARVSRSSREENPEYENENAHDTNQDFFQLSESSMEKTEQPTPNPQHCEQNTKPILRPSGGKTSTQVRWRGETDSNK